MKYKKAIVFFIDILGIKTITDFKTLYKINTIFHDSLTKYQEENLPHTAYNRIVHTFSDCAYIIYDFKDNIDVSRKNIAKLMRVALYNTEALINTFLLHGFICRGGVTYGNVYYEKERSLFFGSAINKAYLLESKKAIYPRILVDKMLVKHINKLEHDLLNDALNNNCPKIFIDNYKLVNGEILKKDTDNLYYLNYFNKLQQGHNFTEKNELIASVKNIINTSINDIKRKLEVTTNQKSIDELNKILQKYTWLETFLEDSLSNANCCCHIMSSS